MIAGVQNRQCLAGNRSGCEPRNASPAICGACLQRIREGRKRFLVGKIEPGGVGPGIAEEFGGQGDLVVPGPDDRHATNDFDGIGDQLVDRDLRVVDAMHEGRVRAVFEQAADQIGKQCFVRADRSIDTAGTIEISEADDLFVKRLAHAVQALKLVFAHLKILAGHVVDGSERLGIVSRELRENHVCRGKQLGCAGEIGDVGMDLSREDRKILEPIELRAFDFGIPIGTLYEPDHDPPAGAAGQIDDEVQHEGAALAIGLHDEAHAVPAGELGVEAELLKEIEREFQPVRFLGVDVEADIVFPGEQGERLHLGQQFAHDPHRLSTGVAGMQRRELDRDAGALIDAPSGGSLADGVNGTLIIPVITLGIGGGGRRLAEHVVGVAEALAFELLRTLQRLLDRLAGDELFAHHPHGHVDAAPDHGLAAARDEPCQCRREAAVVDRGGQLSGDHKPPGRRIDEERAAAAEMRFPVPIGNLVADERVTGRGIGNAQQRFRKAHERHAFLARK